MTRVQSSAGQGYLLHMETQVSHSTHEITHKLTTHKTLIRKSCSWPGSFSAILSTPVMWTTHIHTYIHTYIHVHDWEVQSHSVASLYSHTCKHEWGYSQQRSQHKMDGCIVHELSEGYQFFYLCLQLLSGHPYRELLQTEREWSKLCVHAYVHVCIYIRMCAYTVYVEYTYIYRNVNFTYM